MMLQKDISESVVAHHYNELDDFYRSSWGTHLHHGLWERGDETREEAVEKLSRRVLSELGPLDDQVLIDIGCGYGTTAVMAKESGAREVTGFTISEKQMSFARDHHYVPGIKYELKSWLQNKLPDSSADKAYSIECFSHITDKEKFFSEIKRTLRPGGKFSMTAWLTCPNPGAWEKRFILNPILQEGRLPSLLDKYEVKNLAEKAGLKFKSFTDLSGKVWKTWFLSLGELSEIVLSKKGIRYFANKENHERAFAKTIPRILLGFKTRSFQYGLFTFEA